MAKANPNQQKAYNMMVLQAMKLLYSPEQAASMKSMAQQGNPAEAAASVTAIILKKIQESAAKAGHKLDLQFIKPAGNEIMGHVIEMLVAFKIIPQEQAKSVYTNARQVFQEIVGGGKPAQPQQQQGGLLAQGA